MIDLTNLEEIKKLDPKNVFGSTEMLASQCEQIWQDAKKISYPFEYKEIKNIVLCGMGGSAYAGHIIPNLFKQNLKVPLIVNSDYHLPAFVDFSTLIILASYSGNTEESISCANEAMEKGAKITGITNNGSLRQLLKKNILPALIFDAKFNPSTQPRLATGYMVLGVIGMLKQLELISISDEIVISAINELKSNIDSIKSSAIEIAQKIQNTIPVIFASEFLQGNAHILRNQFNETAKSFSAFSPLPELNHHLMEGLKNPMDKKLTIIFLTSNLYSSVIGKRVELTMDVVVENNIAYIEYQAKGTSQLSQMLNVLSFGGYLSFYLAILYGQDPSQIPWVDYFKEQLKK